MRALLLLALLLAAPTPTPAARALNTEGFRLYQAGKLPEALEKFQAAVRADPQHALAHYNVAATLGVLRKQGKVCEFSAFRDAIVSHLATAVRLDSKRLARAKVDADLDPIRDTLGWQRLLGRSPERVADVPELLRQVSWYGPGVGVYGTTQGLRFLPGGRVVLWQRTFSEDGQQKRQETEGTYHVTGRSVELRLPGRKPLTGTLGVKGALTLQELGTFTDSPSECEA